MGEEGPEALGRQRNGVRVLSEAGVGACAW